MSSDTLTSIPAGTYNIDAVHSNVGFEIKHLGIATVRGSFKKFAGTIVDGHLEGTVEVASVDTGQEQRDGHLQSPDFFDAAQFPEIKFSSTEVETSGDEITLVGDITIKGVTAPITLKGELAEVAEDPQGNARIGFEVAGKIDRTDFGVNFNQILPNGTPGLSNTVKIIVSVSAVKA
jgi:polyisoprenoid-binding protein YceI